MYIKVNLRQEKATGKANFFFDVCRLFFDFLLFFSLLLPLLLGVNRSLLVDQQIITVRFPPINRDIDNRVFSVFGQLNLSNLSNLF